MKKALLLAIISALLAPAAISAADAEDVWASVLFPGIGQVRSGRYGRGSLFASAEILSLAGLFISDIQYDRAVEQYDNAKLNYLNATYIEDARRYHTIMNEKWDSAENLNTYRTVFTGAAVGIWLINIADMVWGGDAEGPELSLEMDSERFLLTKTISF